jgi:preprotein translocase subunit SecD
MCAARFRGAAHAGVVILSLALPTGEAAAEPLQLGIASASAGIDQRNGQAVVDIRLTDESRQRFAAFTLANLGQMIDLRIDGKSAIKPIVREPIAGGMVQITIDNPGEAERLAARLNDRTATLEVDSVPH